MAQHALLPALTGRSLSRVSTKLSAARPHSGALVTTTTDSQLLQLVDCGSAGLSCLTLSISAGLTGSTAASPLLRRLASASLAAYALDVYQPPEGSPDAVPTGAELDSFYAWSFEEAVCARTYGCALGQQTIVALSTALGVPIHYSMRLEDGNMPWDVTLATTPAGLARSTSAQPLYVWHTGSFHYMCGVPVSEGAVWSPPWSSWSEVEINAMLTTCIDEAEAAARLSPHAAARDMQAKSDAFWTTCGIAAYPSVVAYKSAKRGELKLPRHGACGYSRRPHPRSCTHAHAHAVDYRAPIRATAAGAAAARAHRRPQRRE